MRIGERHVKTRCLFIGYLRNLSFYHVRTFIRFAEDQANPLDATGNAVRIPNKVTDTLKLPIKYNPKTMSVEKCSAILLSYPGTNIALEAQAHLIAHEVYSQRIVDINASMRSLYQQYGSLSSMTRAVKIIASAYEEKEDYAAAIPFYTEAINTLKDKNSQYWLKGSLVRSYIETGQNDKADALITEVLAQCLADSSNAGSLKIFLFPLNTDKTLAAAARVYSEALKAWGAFDLSCAVRYRLVRAYIQFKEYDKATALAQIAFERDIDNPDEVQAILNIARMISKLGDKEKEEAAKVYQAIIQKYPEHVETHEAYERLIMVLLDLGREKQVAQLVEDYTAKYAGKPEYMNSPDGEHAMFVPRAKEIVRRLQKQGQADEALTLAEGLTAGVEKPSLDLAKALAVSQIKTGKLAEATAATEKLLKDYPMDEAGAMAVVEVAGALREAGKTDKAMELYDYVMGITKGTKAEAMARAGRAQIWVRQGKDEDVKAEVDAIVASANSLPDADKAVLVIGEEYYLKGQKISVEGNAAAAKAAWEKAVAILKTSLDMTTVVPNRCSAYYTAGLCYQQLGDYVKAADAFQASYQADPKFKYADYCLFAQGDCHEILMKSKAISEAGAEAVITKVYSELVSKYPQSQYTTHAKSWLQKDQH